MAFTGKSIFDTYAYENEFFFGRLQSIQSNWKQYLDIIPMGKEPLGTEKDVYYEDQFMYFSSALAANYTSATDTTVDVTAGHGGRFRVGDVIQFGEADITYAISAISTDTLTIGSAAHYGTKADASSGATVTIVSRAELSGEDANVAARDMTAQPYERTCNTSLIKQTILLSKDELTAAKKYGVNGVAMRLAMEENKAINSVLRILAYQSMMAYHAAAESASVRGYMDGLIPTIKTANSISGGSITADTIIDAFYTHQADGANGCTHALCSPDMHAEIVKAFDAQITNNAAYPQLTYPVANTVFGPVQLISDPRMRVAKCMLLVDMNLISMHNKQGMAFELEELAKTGDHYKAQIVGRYGQKIYGRDNQHAYVTFS